MSARRRDELFGAERAMRLLASAIERGEVAHAYLFSGPEGVGKRHGALAFAKSLFCESTPPRPCGFCDACESVAALRHEDLLVLHGDSNPLWHDPASLARAAGLAEEDREGVAAVLERIAGHDLIARPVPLASEKRRLWPIAFAKDVLGAGESARAREQGNALARIERLAERGTLSETHARLARLIAVPPLSLALYRRGARGLGIGAIAPRESGHGRSVKAFFEKRPSRGARKIAIVDEAHWMTEEAQNSFLKTLEEPPPDVTLILVTHNPGALLPTIRSRVTTVPWRGLSESEMEAFLARATDYDEADRRILCVAAGGAPGLALRQEPAAFVALRAMAVDLLRASVAGDLPRFLSLAARLHQARTSRDDERSRLDQILDMLLLYLRDLRACELLGPDAVLANGDLRAELAADATRFPARLAATAAERIFDARARLAMFSDPRLVLEGLFLSLFPRGDAALAPSRAAGA
ncbi:MAG: ATP-binding protein [bacterium]